MRAVAARLSVALMTLLTATAVHAQSAPQPAGVPRVVRMTGVFVPADGQPPNPVETVTLAIYADQKGGTPLWQETQTVAVDPQGRYTVLLGREDNGLPATLFLSGDARWLGQRFDRSGEQELPRVLLASVPYAMKASDADTLGGQPASAYVLAGAAAPSGAAVLSATTPTLTAADGTVGHIGKFISTTQLGDSVMVESNGLIGLNSTNPRDALDVQFLNQNGAMTGFAVQNLGSTATSYSGMLFYDQNGALGQFQGFNNSTHEYRINNIASGGSINFMIGSSSKFKVATNGFIGIGTATPTVPLDIVGTASVGTTGSGSYFLGGSTTLTTGTNIGWSTTLRTSDGILSGNGVLTLSDARAKIIQGRSDSAADLGTLLGIEVTDFVFKDAIQKGNHRQKKVIAQQVEKVFPQAVTQTTDVVPDIFRKAPVHGGWIELATDLKVGERVRLISEDGRRGVHEVLEVKPDSFRTDFVDEVPQVFVYGREVKDFRVVDYDAISMLNVSATQELNRIIMQQNSEIQTLSARLAALEQLLKEQLPRQKQP